VFTGLSGSGKSTLAIDTLHTEGQRQYLESLGLVDYVSKVPISDCGTLASAKVQSFTSRNTSVAPYHQ
jgi:excinuclease ABC subunit A